MASAPKRGRNIVVKSQFNINGSRGKDVGSFISDYVAREDATDASMAYVPDNRRIPESGDGVAFTLDSTAISKQETLRLASHVQTLHEQGNRAIQQLVISFAPEYLVEQGLVPEGLPIMRNGDYKYNYDDIRLRHAIRAGIHAMIENEGYYDGNMVAAIQSDTLHLHVHAVIYEDFHKIARKYGKEERGIIRESSLSRLTFHIDRELQSTLDLSVVPTQRLLSPEILESPRKISKVEYTQADVSFVDDYLRLLLEQEREEALSREGVIDEIADSIVIDGNEALGQDSE